MKRSVAKRSVAKRSVPKHRVVPHSVVTGKGASLACLFAVLVSMLVLPLAGHAFALDHLQTEEDIGPNKVPNRGQSQILVIIQRSFGTVDPELVEELTAFYNPDGGPETFRGFWQAASRGLYDPIPTLVAPLLYDTCPVPGIDPDLCKLSLDDLSPLLDGALHQALTKILEDVRDRDGLDLRTFDINGRGCEMGMVCPDGWLDGLIIDTDTFGGLAFPLSALAGPVVVDARVNPIDEPPEEALVRVGIVALTPPARHEFAHNLGFIDSYNGPTLNGLMAWNEVGLSAYSRLRIRWGEDRVVDGPGSFTLAPVLAGGEILRVGAPPQFLLIENRGGPDHAAWNRTPAGLNVYAVDEDQLPDTELGFLDILAGDLYYPNQSPPYFNVNLPLGCTREAGDDSCVLTRASQWIELDQIITGPSGFWVVVDEILADGSMRISIVDEEPLPPTPVLEPEPEPEPEPRPMPSCACAPLQVRASTVVHHHLATLLFAFAFGLRILTRRQRRD